MRHTSCRVPLPVAITLVALSSGDAPVGLTNAAVVLALCFKTTSVMLLSSLSTGTSTTSVSPTGTVTSCASASLAAMYPVLRTIRSRTMLW